MQKHSFDPSLFSKKPLTKIDSNFSKNPLTKIDSNLSKNPLTKLDTNFSKKPSTKFESNISKRPLNKTPSFVPSVVIMGISGRGKSNLLNYLMQHPAEAIKNPLFPSKAGAGSCTIEVSEPLSGYIYGTNQKITVIDTPGSFSVDIPLDEWLELMTAKVPKAFNCLIWVLNVKERVTPGEGALSQALERIFDNFTMDKIIIVFTHCDMVAANHKIDVGALAKDWVNLLNTMVKTKIDTINIITYGMEINGYDNSRFIPSFLQALNEVPRKAELSIKQQIDKMAVMDDILMSVDQNMANQIKEEQKNLKEKIKKKDEEIVMLKNKPPQVIHHYTTIVEDSGSCNIF